MLIVIGFNEGAMTKCQNDLQIPLCLQALIHLHVSFWTTINFNSDKSDVLWPLVYTASLLVGD